MKRELINPLLVRVCTLLGNVATILLSMSFCGEISAQTNNAQLVVPPQYAEVDGGNLSGSGLLKYVLHLQEIYNASMFPPQPISIHEIRLRASAVYGEPFDCVVSNLQINLSTTTVQPENISATFTNNVGTNDTVVFQGSIQLTSNFSGPTNGPKTFDIIIPLTSPFLYDPLVGNLCVDWRNYSGSCVTFLDVGGVARGQASRAFSVSMESSHADTIDAGAEILQIIYSSESTGPWIVSQPQSQEVPVGVDVTFGVIAAGTPPFTYQWLFNGTNIDGATNSTLILSNVQGATVGSYSVEVSNGAGSILSSNAILTISESSRLVVPSVNQSTEGGGGSSLLSSAIRLQEVYGASLFPDHVITIHEIRVRPSAIYGQAFTNTIADLQINLSTTLREPETLSSTFADNLGLDDTVVFHGSISLSSRFTGPSGGPKDFDIVIQLATPFVYDPRGGNLCVDWRNHSGSSVTFVDAGGAANDHANRAFALGAGSTSATTVDSGAEVLQIVYTVDPVTASRTLALISPPSQQEGAHISVPLELWSDGDVGGITFLIRYDSRYLGNAELSWSPSLSQAFNSVNSSIPGEIRATLALSGETIPAGTQQVATINFLLRSVPVNLDTELALQLSDASSVAGDPITQGNSTRNASVQITKRSFLGDNNANQRLDVGDATVILRFLTALDIPRTWDVAGNDLNANQKLDTGDAIKVLRAAAGIDPQPGAPAPPQPSPLVKKSASSIGELITLSPTKPRGNPGDLITFQVQLQNIQTALAGAGFTITYPTNALRLGGSQPYRFGSLVPSGSLAAWNTAQNGRLSLAVSAATGWPASNGILAEITFQVQPGAAQNYSWPLALSAAEITRDGYETRALLPTGASLIGRDAVRGTFSAPTRSNSGQFQFTLSGDPGATYTIETSSDLIHWTSITNIPLDGTGTSPFAEQTATNIPRRFYRTVVNSQ